MIQMVKYKYTILCQLFFGRFLKLIAKSSLFLLLQQKTLFSLNAPWEKWFYSIRNI